MFILQFGAPEFDGPIERGRQKQVGKINLGEDGKEEGRDRRKGEKGRKGEGREGRKLE